MLLYFLKFHPKGIYDLYWGESTELCIKEERGKLSAYGWLERQSLKKKQTNKQMEKQA